METPPTTTTTVSRSRGIFGTNIPASAAFIIAILLFLLPFAEIKCGDETMANQTGIGFAMASEWKARGSFNQDDLAKAPGAKKESPTYSQLIIIAVLVLTLMGVALSLANANGSLAAPLGLVAAAGLIYFMTDLKNDFNANMKKETVDQAEQGARDVGLNNMANAFNDVKPSLIFTQWFWLAVVILLAAAVFSWMRERTNA